MNDYHHQPSRKLIDSFVRSENVARFSRMLATEGDDAEREILTDLIAAERQKQRSAGD